jgi:hypothetical protein
LKKFSQNSLESTTLSSLSFGSSKVSSLLVDFSTKLSLSLSVQQREELSSFCLESHGWWCEKQERIISLFKK